MDLNETTNIVNINGTTRTPAVEIPEAPMAEWVPPLRDPVVVLAYQPPSVQWTQLWALAGPVVVAGLTGFIVATWVLM